MQHNKKAISHMWFSSARAKGLCSIATSSRVQRPIAGGRKATSVAFHGEQEDGGDCFLNSHANSKEREREGLT